MPALDTEAFATAADEVLAAAVTADAPVAGVVAGLTDRHGTLYEGVAGSRELGGDQPMTVDTVFAIFSTTKAITATAALTLLEDGSLDLDAPARDYAPAIGELQVIEGFDDDGEAILRPPASDVTTRQLLTHSGGFGYDFFNETYQRLAQEKGQPSVITASREALTTPLLFDPGTRWEYGTNIDWVGQVIEGITGRRLGEVIADAVLAPCGISSMTFAIDDERRARVAAMHARGADGSLTPIPFELPSPPEVDFGGHGLYGTVPDYLKFIRMWLADGLGEEGRVLTPETVEMAVQRHLADDLSVTLLPGVDPALSNDAEFFPGVAKSWSLPFMVNDEAAPTGRRPGLGRVGEPLLLGRPGQRHRRLLGHPDPPVRRPDLLRPLPRLRDRRLRQPHLTAGLTGPPASPRSCALPSTGIRSRRRRPPSRTRPPGRR